MKSVGILGLGRFGQLLQKMLMPNFQIKSFDPKIENCHAVTEVLQQTTLFIAVPIRHFESVIQTIAPQLSPGTTIIDVLSVKVHPVKIMQQYLDPSIDIIATHPLFGPDSFNNPQFTKKIMMASIRDQYQHYLFWKDFFIENQIQVEEMTPDQHDQTMAQSQGITHLIGRTLEKIQAHATPIDTAGYAQLLKIMQLTCNDSFELFLDLQKFNPYSKAENLKFKGALDDLLFLTQGR